MNRYIEMRDRQQAEFNALPIGFAFGEKQFAEMMHGWGLDPETDCDKIVRIFSGAYVQKKDRESVLEALRCADKEQADAIAADETGEGFVYEMFLYELENHEFSYTGDPDDAFAACGFSYEEVLQDDKLRRGYYKAASKIINHQ